MATNRPQRIVKKSHNSPILGVDQEKKLTKIVIDSEQKTFLLKNVMPSGKFSFRADDDSAPMIEAQRTFEVTESELELILEHGGFEQGLVCFMDTYEGYDNICNAMSDKKIVEICELPKKEFEEAVSLIDSVLTFDRIKKVLTENDRPAGYLQFVEFHEKGLREKYLQSQKYETAAQRNQRLLKQMMGG